MEIIKSPRGRPRVAQPMIRTSVTVSPEFYKKCKQNLITFSEALRVGISVLLAEKGVADYDNRLTIVRRLSQAVEKLSETSQELNNLKEKYKKI